jgi:hypothetical protein
LCLPLIPLLKNRRRFPPLLEIEVEAWPSWCGAPGDELN